MIYQASGIHDLNGGPIPLPDEEREFPKSLADELVKLIVDEINQPKASRFMRAAHICKHAHQLVQMFKTNGEASPGDFDAQANPCLQPMYSTETFAAKAVKEIVAVADKFAPKATDNSLNLVLAIAEAKRNGLDNVAEHLEKRLISEGDSVEPAPVEGTLEEYLPKEPLKIPSEVAP